MRPRPGYVLLGVGAVVLGLALVPHTATSAATRPVVREVPVVDATLVCPQVAAQDSVTASQVAAGSPAQSGSLEVRRLTGPAASAPLARLVGAGQQLTYRMGKGTSVPLLVRATGARARGLTASVYTRVADGPQRSIRSAACTQPSGDTWFVGGSTVAGRRDVVFLTNADPAPAVVDVAVYGAQGQSAAEAGQGVPVPPHAQVQLALDALAPGLAWTAVEVHARSGRVAAGLLDVATNGLTPQGTDWVPPSAAPSHHAVVVGIPSDPGTGRRLLLLVPGQLDAQVTVRLATRDGTLSPPLSPTQPNTLAVPGGRLVAVDLAGTGVTGAYSVLVDSDQPIVAGVWAQRAAHGKLPDFSYAAGADPVVGTAVLLPRAVRSATEGTVLQLTATSGDVVVRLTSVPASGTAPAPVTVTVPGGRVLEVPVGIRLGGSTTVLVEAPAGSGLVVGWVSTELGRRGPLVTGGPLLQTPLTVPLPPVAADPAVGYAGH